MDAGNDERRSSDDAPSTGARTTLGTYSTLSTLSNDGVLPYDLAAAATAHFRGDYAHGMGSSMECSLLQTPQVGIIGIPLTASALLASEATTPVSTRSTGFPSSARQQHHQNPPVRPIVTHCGHQQMKKPLSSSQPTTPVKSGTVRRGPPPALLPFTPAVATPVSRLATATRAMQQQQQAGGGRDASKDNPIVSSTTGRYQATRDWVGTSSRGGISTGADNASPDMALSRTNTSHTLIAAGFELVSGEEASPSALSGSAGWNNVGNGIPIGGGDFEWVSCSPCNDGTAAFLSRGGGLFPHVSSSSPVAASRCASALSDPAAGVDGAVGDLFEVLAEEGGLASLRASAQRHSVTSRQDSDHQFETASTASASSHRSAVVQMPVPILAGALSEEAPLPDDDLTESEREAILTNNRSPPLFLLNRQEQAQQLLRCYLAFSAAEKLFGSARMAYSGGSASQRNRFLVSAAAAASAFHLFGGPALAGHPTAVSLAAANFRTAFAAAASLQSGSSTSIVPNLGGSFSSLIYGKGAASSGSAPPPFLFSVPGYQAPSRATNEAALRAIPTSPDEERNIYFPPRQDPKLARDVTVPTATTNAHQHPSISYPPQHAVAAGAGKAGGHRNDIPQVIPLARRGGGCGVEADAESNEETASNIFGGDSFDTWVSGVVVPSSNPAKAITSPAQREGSPRPPAACETDIRMQSATTAAFADSSVRHAAYPNSPAAPVEPSSENPPPRMPPPVSSWASGLSGSKPPKSSEDWDVLSPNRYQQRHQIDSISLTNARTADWGFDECSVAASGSSKQNPRVPDGVTASTYASVTKTAADAITKARVRDPLQPVVLPRAGSSWASISSAGRVQPGTTTWLTECRETVALPHRHSVQQRQRVQQEHCSDEPLSASATGQRPTSSSHHYVTALYELDDF